MSTEKLTELDKRLSIHEVTVTKVLQAVEKQANSTERLNESVIKMTTSFDYLREDVKELEGKVEAFGQVALENKSEISIMKNGNKWQEYAKRALTTAIVGAVLGLIFIKV